MSDTEEGPSKFEEALKTLLAEHGKTLADLSLASPTPAKSDPDVPKDVEETIIKHVISSSSTQRRRLRLFSGRTPVPSGELDFEGWRRPAKQLVDDKDLSESEKFNRIVESLLPPASDIAWALGKDATSSHVLDGLEKAYGSTIDGDELYLKFSECYQSEQETASDYLLRLQGLLSKAIEAGGVAPERADNVRVQQFARGCLYNDPLLVALDLKRRQTPPDFVTLLQEVRREEQTQADRAARRKGEPKGKKVATHEQSVNEPEDKMIELSKQVTLLQQQLETYTRTKESDSNSQPS